MKVVPRLGTKKTGIYFLNPHKMKKKSIKSILEKKLDAWCASIDDESVRQAIINGAIVTGGSIASLLLNEDVNDFDIYFKTKDTLKTVVNYYAKKTNGSMVVIDGECVDKTGEVTDGYSIACSNADKDRIKLYASNGSGFYKNEESKGEPESFELLFCSPNAITLSDKVQIVVRFWGETDVIHRNYDYVHATNSYDYGKKQLILRQEALESLITKDLYYIGSKYPLTSIIRSKKFIKRGWKISAGQYLKMIFQCSELDLKDPTVLEEQLVGVDIAYFQILIDALKQADSNKIEYSYIAKIIDRIFED